MYVYVHTSLGHISHCILYFQHIHTYVHMYVHDDFTLCVARTYCRRSLTDSLDSGGSRRRDLTGKFTRFYLMRFVRMSPYVHMYIRTYIHTYVCFLCMYVCCIYIILMYNGTHIHGLYSISLIYLL